MKFQINTLYTLEALIEIVKNKSDRHFDKSGKEMYVPGNMYAVYISKFSNSGNMKKYTAVYIGKTVEIDENNEEIYPNVVVENDLELWYSCQNFQDVIDLAYSQKNNASFEEIISCLNHYAEGDDFLDLIENLRNTPQ